MNPKPRKEIDTSTYTGRFATRLKMLREKAGLSVEDVANSMSVTAKTVYTWEDGTRVLPPQKFPEIAILYKLKKIRYVLPDE